ncbi:MAG: hypothetical protein OQK70_12670, partial [Gammaproteobacteria bacterium]|nr:hypothetical protein [Gammaproteobacteria bacterium]
NSSLSDITRFTVEYPLEAGAIAFIVGFFILLISGDIPWRDWNWVNDVTRLANTLPKKFGGFVLIIMSVLLMLVALSFIGVFI